VFSSPNVMATRALKKTMKRTFLYFVRRATG